MRWVSRLLVCSTATVLLAQTPDGRPEFRNYAVVHIHSAPPALPKLSNDQQSFRTRIRKGAKSPVEFAGHYTVPRFGCGTECISFYIVDSITGRVYDCFSVADLPDEWTERHGDHDTIEFRKDSRLLKVNGCINEHNCGFYDFEMIDRHGLKLVKKHLLAKQFQPQ